MGAVIWCYETQNESLVQMPELSFPFLLLLFKLNSSVFVFLFCQTVTADLQLLPASSCPETRGGTFDIYIHFSCCSTLWRLTSNPLYPKKCVKRNLINQHKPSFILSYCHCYIVFVTSFTHWTHNDVIF